MKPVGMALKRAGLAFALLGLLSPAMVASAQAQSPTCGGNLVFGGDNLELDCKESSCSFDESLRTYAYRSVYGYCYDGNQKVAGKLTLTEADACITCKSELNGQKLDCQNTGDYPLDYTVTVDCQ